MLFPHVKYTKQMGFSFLFKGRSRILRANPLGRTCQRATFKVNANGYHSDTPMDPAWESAKDLKTNTTAWKPHKNTAQTYRDSLRKHERLREMEIHRLTHSQRKWISASNWLSDRQIVCLEIIEPQKWGRGGALKFICTKNETEREDARRSQYEKGENEDDILTE